MAVRFSIVTLGALALGACQKSPVSPPTPTPSATATVVVAVPVPVATTPTPVPEHTKGIAATPDPTVCGADKLGPYLNLLPTTTAQGEIAKTVGHNRLRLLGANQAATGDFRADRLTITLGVDGRIKQFRCG